MMTTTFDFISGVFPMRGSPFCRLQTRSIGEMLGALILIWAVLTPEEMENHVEFL
jgi:hypothetical protein